MTLKQFKEKTALPLFYVGPDLTEGPLPSVLYLALSAKETLLTDPFNQPVLQFNKLPIRVFSVDLPFHGEGLDSRKALEEWAHAFARGEDVVSNFLLKLEETLSHLFNSKAIKNNNLAVMGLSRGGFLVNHLAARMS
ncbi:MAG: alpha/beta hydrolase, partial [Chlamydiota bacterium]